MKNIVRSFSLCLILIANVSIATSVYKTSTVRHFGTYGNGFFVSLKDVTTACGNDRYFMDIDANGSGAKVVIAGIISAFHANTEVTINGTGQCHHAWTGDEVINTNNVHFSK